MLENPAVAYQQLTKACDNSLMTPPPHIRARPPILQSIEFLLGVIFDARRAVYFRDHRLLAVADLHLGYAWSHRAQGQLMPVATKDSALDRLRALVTDYQPKQ